MTLRLIEGGRGNTDAPGLLVHGAAQVATLAGGLRRGHAQADAAVLDSTMVGGPGSPDAPVVACWEGRIVGVGPRADVERSLEAGGYALSRFARLDADGGVVTPGSWTRTPTSCSRARASRSWSCASAAPATWRSSPPAAASCRRSR